MTMITDNPWEDLKIPADGVISSRRIKADYPHDFYFSKDSSAKYMLVFSLSKSTGEREKILLNGINVSNVYAGGKPSITLTLKNNDDWPIFLKICLDLCKVASEVKREDKAVDSFYNRLLYWQYFLKRNSEDRLSKEEQIGLAGELLFLEKNILSQYNALDSINFWTGSDGDVQDFFIGGKRIEVKTCLSPSKNEINISSLQQLYDAECSIYLVVAYIGMAAVDSRDAFSLCSLANRVAERLNKENAQAHELFIKKLAAVGMFLDGTYSDTFYVANKFKGYRVQGNFPRITPEDVKEGIAKVKYIVSLGCCRDYETPLKEVFEEK